MRKSRRLGNKIEPYLFLSPSYFILLLFMAYPLINCIRLAFSDYRLNVPGARGFCGLENFEKIFSSPDFLLICKNTVVFVVATVSVQFILGMILALALRKPFKGQGVVRSIVFLPWAFSGFVIGLSFQWFFNAEYGPLNDLLLRFGIINEKLYMLSDPDLALFSVVIALAWQGIPFFAMMILAALQSIPKDVYEAADLDGANSIQQFSYVTLPYIKPTIVLTLLVRTVWVFNNSEMIYVMTRGGPANHSNTLASAMFMKAYATLDFGQAGALGLMFILILMVFTVIYLKLTKFNEEQ